MHDLDLDDVQDTSFAPPPADAAWHQFDFALLRVDGDARPSARALFARVLPWWWAARARGEVTRWFFMRKPPDVRLRVLCAPRAEGALADFAALCGTALVQGEIAAAGRGEYQPEDARFGGRQALDCAHAWFTLDSVLWWLLDCHAVRGVPSPSTETWLRAIYDDLFACVGADDGWRRLAQHVELPLPTDAPPGGVGGDALAALAAQAAPPVAALAAAYQVGNRRLAAALRDVTLQVGHSAASVAALIAFFTCNRHGLPGERSRPLVARVLADAQNGR
ncbi:MAG: thiopeptide-type bacteriocin biosynthesis protein [Gammaproteobacteria bacterium]